MKKFALPLIAAFVFVSPLLAQQAGASQAGVSQADAKPDDAGQDRVVEEIVARVNNAIITRADLRRNQEQIAADAKEQNLTRSQVEERQQNSLRDLIDQQLLIQKAAELGISADADLIKRLDDLRKQMKAASLEELQKMAEAQGVNWEEFKQNTKNGILTQKVIGSEVGSHIQLTQDELRKYYNEHKDDFTQPERVRLSEILIANDPKAPKGSPIEATPDLVAAAQAKAEDVLRQLKGGAKFDELARQLSNGATAEQGGDLGYFKRNDLAKQLEDRTFALKAGEFTPIIRTRQGFVILLVTDHIEAGTPPFENVREQIQDQIYAQRIQPALRTYLGKLREEAYIDVKDGYTDSGASPNQSSLVWATDSGPRTKEVRGHLGMGKKKTVIVSGDDKPEPLGGASELGSAKADADAKAEAKANVARDCKAEENAAAAEEEKLSRMSPKQQKKYLKEKKREAKQEGSDDCVAQRRSELAEKEVQPATATPATDSEAAKTEVQEKPAGEQLSANNTPAETDPIAAEERRLSHMTPKEQKKYLAAQKRDAKRNNKGAKRKQKEEKDEQAGNPSHHKDKQAKKADAKKQKQEAKAAAKPDQKQQAKTDKKADKKQQAKAGKKADKKKQAKADNGQQADSNSQADSSQPQKKKKFSWF